MDNQLKPLHNYDEAMVDEENWKTYMKGEVDCSHITNLLYH